MNFTRVHVFTATARNSGRVWRRATATTISGGGQSWPNGADPRAEGSPHQLVFGGGKDLQQALGDEAELDVAMVGGDLAADGVAVFLRCVVHRLVAADGAYRRHISHPEVIGIGADAVDGLLEGHFDFESQAIEADDVERSQGRVGAHQQDGAALGVEYGDEADEDAGGAPQQVGGAELELEILVAIDGAERFLE